MNQVTLHNSNTEELNFALHVCQHLDTHTERLDAAIADRLFQARQLALGRARPSFVGKVSTGLGFNVDLYLHRGRALFATGLALALIGSGLYLRETIQIDDNADIDTALLSDDLPIEAYLDNDFDSWLQEHDPS